KSWKVSYDTRLLFPTCFQLGSLSASNSEDAPLTSLLLGFPKWPKMRMHLSWLMQPIRIQSLCPGCSFEARPLSFSQRIRPVGLSVRLQPPGSGDSGYFSATGGREKTLLSPGAAHSSTYKRPRSWSTMHNQPSGSGG